METLAPFITALTTAIALLSTVWVYRKTGTVKNVHAGISLILAAYAIYHYLACSAGLVVSPIDSIITGLVVSGVSWLNAYSAFAKNIVNIGINRRKTVATTQRVFNERRKTTSHTLFKTVEKV